MDQPALPTVVRSSSIAMTLFVSLALAACDSPATDADAPLRGAQAPQTARESVTALPVAGPQRTILAFGDSLFAGYNVPKDDSYPAQLETALREAGVNARVVNAGVSGDTSAAGRQRFQFTLDGQEETPELLILELGGNDLLRAIQPSQTRANLAAMIETAQARGIEVLLMGMQAPPNVGPEYREEFNAIYPSLAQEYGVALIPNWIEGVADQPELIQTDRIHPTVEGIALLVSDTVDEVTDAIPEAD